MTLDTTINLPTIVTLGMAVLAVIIWLIRLESGVKANRRDLDDLDMRLGAIQALIALHKEQFHAYQLDAERKFITREIIIEIKHDFITELNRMEQRVEQQISRLVEGRP